MSRASRLQPRAMAPAASEATSPAHYARGYSVVPPEGVPAEVVRDVVLAAIDVAWRLAMAEAAPLGAMADHSPLTSSHRDMQHELQMLS